jgi:hypothetical protein
MDHYGEKKINGGNNNKNVVIEKGGDQKTW